MVESITSLPLWGQFVDKTWGYNWFLWIIHVTLTSSSLHLMLLALSMALAALLFLMAQLGLNGKCDKSIFFVLFCLIELFLETFGVITSVPFKKDSDVQASINERTNWITQMDRRTRMIHLNLRGTMKNMSIFIIQRIRYNHRKNEWLGHYNFIHCDVIIWQ